MRAADVVIASNRGPVSFHRDEHGAVTSSRGGGGLVSGLAGLAPDAATVWVCAALSDTDRAVAAAAQDGELDLAGQTGTPAVRMLALDAATMAGAYTTISNTTLWYLHHGLTDITDAHPFDDGWRRAWESYVAYNSAFAEAVTEVAAPGARLLAQDYHLSLLPALTRTRRADLRISLFTHTPWATPEEFASLPGDVARAVLVGMLGADSLGFHSARWARAFVECAVAVLGVETDDGGVTHDGRRTAIRIQPLGVEAAPLLARAAQPDVVRSHRELAARIGGRRTIVRVDRTEPSKNIVGGLAAFRDLLERFPEHRERVLHLAIAYPSRQDQADYRRYTATVERMAREINDEYATATWTPVWLSIKDSYPDSLATLQLGDVLLVNPLRDGMNLVAKEGALLSTDGVLILSRQAGAADELGEFALLVDPADVAGTATAMHEALRMSAEERADRHRGLVRAATAHAPQEWLREQLDGLA